MRAFEHDGLALHYADEGPRDGTPVVFSNSLGTDFRVWDGLLPHLPHGLRLVRYDTAGHGLSALGGDRSIGAHAEDVAALMTHLGIERAAFVGLSVGGLIAQALAAAHPARVSALALCDTGHKIGTDDLWNDRIAKIENGGIAAIADAILERWFTPRFRSEDPAFPLWRAMLLRTPVEGYCALARAIRDADYTESTRRIAIPALCVVGAEDGATPPALVRELSDLIPGAAFAEIDDCGHLPCVEQPERLGALLSEFFGKHLGAV